MLPLVGTKARAATQIRSWHQPDVGLHRGGTNRHGADGDARRDQSRHLGAQARFFSRRCFILPVRGALYTLSDNAAWLVGVQTPRWHWRGNLWCDIPGHRRRSDAQHRPLQCSAGCHHHRAKYRRRALDDAGGTDRRQSRLQRCVSHARLPLPPSEPRSATFALPETREISTQGSRRWGQTARPASRIAAG